MVAYIQALGPKHNVTTGRDSDASCHSSDFVDDRAGAVSTYLVWFFITRARTLKNRASTYCEPALTARSDVPPQPHPAPARHTYVPVSKIVKFDIRMTRSDKSQILWMCQAMDSLSVAESIVGSSNYRGWNSRFSILQQNFTDTVEIRLYSHEKSRTLSKSDCTYHTSPHEFAHCANMKL